MNNKESNFSAKTWISILLLGLTGAFIYYMPYLRWTYYDVLMEASGLNNTQFGFTMSIFGITAMIGYPFGGILADKVKPNILLFIAMVGSGILGFWYAVFPSYMGQIIIFAGWGILSTLTFWAAMLKATRGLGNEEQQGRLFGLVEGGRGLLTTIVGFAALALFSKLGEGVLGMQMILRIVSALCIAVGVLALLFLRENAPETATEEKQPLKFSDIIAVLKTPAVWLISLVIVCCYSVYLGSTYLTPYFTNVIGATASVAALLAIMRTYILQFLCGPTGGMLADKTKSISKVVLWCYVLMTLSLIVIIILPTNSSSMIPLVILMILLCAGIFAMRGIYFATTSEADIPMHVMGTAVGIISLIGFTPDIFMSPICGTILDRYEGAFGYKLIFLLMMAFTVVGLIASFLLLKNAQKAKKA